MGKTARTIFPAMIEQRAVRELHHLVLFEEEEAVRFRRRMHIHFVLLSFSGMLSFLSIYGIASITLVTGCSFGILSLQELVDYAGRF
jgi:hypothetical protein